MDRHDRRHLEDHENFVAGRASLERSADMARVASGLRLVQAAFTAIPTSSMNLRGKTTAVHGLVVIFAHMPGIGNNDCSQLLKSTSSTVKAPSSGSPLALPRKLVKHWIAIEPWKAAPNDPDLFVDESTDGDFR
jgi:hypothetical protein